MKNKLWIIFLILAVIAVGFGFYFFTQKNNTNQNDYTASKTATNEQNSLEKNSNIDNSTDLNQNNIKEKNVIEITRNSTGNEQKVEQEISSFSTKIYTKDSARQNNISITCSTLNDSIIPNGSTFSFCDTVGKATTAKGYQEADIFDKDGNKKKGLGGGNCQVSTTLYNAVLNTAGLTITERHEHSNKVPYIENGKDAAVAYGSYDLKFKNDTGFDVEIKATNTSDAVTITLYKLV